MERGPPLRFAVAVLALLGLFAVPSTPMLEPAPPSDGDDVAITYKTHRCFGSCPVYSITICGNGTVHYNGRMFTKTIGYDRYSISDERVQSLVDTVYGTDFYRLREEYNSRKSEPWRRTVTVRIGEWEHSVTESHNGAPDRLDELRQEITAIAADRIEKRVNRQPRDPPTTNTRRCH